MKYLSAALAPALLFPAMAPAQSVFELDEIVFSANLAAIEAARSGVTVEVITEEDLSAAGDLQISDYLARLPGLTVTRDGPVGQNSFPRIRGLDGRYIAVRINGIDVNDPSLIQNQTNFGGLTTANVSRIEVLYGSQIPRFYSESGWHGHRHRTTRFLDEYRTEKTLSLEPELPNLQGSLSTEVPAERAPWPFPVSLGTDRVSAAEENMATSETHPTVTDCAYLRICRAAR